MLFNSFQFLIFFAVVTGSFYWLPHRYRWLLLLVASYYFYMNWAPVYALLILFSTGLTYTCALMLEKVTTRRIRKILLTISIISNLSVLFLFKYFNFLNQSVYEALSFFNIRWEVPGFSLLLPVGISFYTFQAVGYTIDVYRGEMRAERHLGIYALFVSFFPQLVAGPIERAKNLLPQFYQKQFFDPKRVASGLKWMLWGLFIKVVVADRAAIYVDAVYNNVDNHTGSSFLVATVLFAIQIYGDFAGYSTIAVGCAKVLGFDLMTNFKRPYFAPTITQFWRRWHISLSTWFKDYLYFPLGGSRVGQFRSYLNILITFLISGLWHGAKWTFVVWGGIHGVLLVVEKALGAASRRASMFGRITQYAVCMCVVILSWVFFRANSLQDSFVIVKGIFFNVTSPVFQDKTTFFYLLISLPILVVVEVVQEFFPQSMVYWRRTQAFRAASYLYLLVAIMLVGVFDGGQFIYFQF